ncbi:MAG: glycosyltransferase [Bacteroidetes bacterium]|nr:glycosyltransferase [Bacteroidota bacterium]
MSGKIKALWLTSWYPNELDAMNGDFIQRHAYAASLFADITVIHAEPDIHQKMSNKVSVSGNGQLKEIICYFPIAKGPSFIAKMRTGIGYKKLMKTQVQKFIAENGLPDIVHVHVPIKAGLIALWLKKKYHIPYVVTEHWAIYNEVAKDKFADRNFIFKTYTKKILKNGNLFLPVSRQLGNAVNKYVTKINFKAIPNVADTRYFHFPQQVEMANKVFTFIHVSTMKMQKNPQGIIHAFSIFIQKHPNSKLIMVGEHFEPIEQYATSLGIPPENIEFTGLLSYTEVASKMQMADALLLFSRFENLPCVIIEALCCGLPVISTNVGGIAELINERNGVLIENEDEQSLIQYMQELYLNTLNFNREKISKDACEKYNYQTIGGEIFRTYETIIKRK